MITEEKSYRIISFINVFFSLFLFSKVCDAGVIQEFSQTEENLKRCIDSNSAHVEYSKYFSKAIFEAEKLLSSSWTKSFEYMKEFSEQRKVLLNEQRIWIK
jgi:hypothetical protein